MKIRYGVATHPGLKRKNNEDNYCIDESLGLFVVVDGLGGHRSGEIASKMAVETIKDGLGQLMQKGRSAIMGEYDNAFSLEANLLGSSIRLANRVIYEASNNNPEYSGMSSTVVSVLVHGNTAALAHVGDSRIYIIRDSQIEQLSEDHSFVVEQVKRGIITEEEAERSELKNIIVRALGAEEEVEVTLDEVPILENDYFLLCSDGLTDMLTDEEIKETVLKNGDDPQKACDKLVNMANKKGGVDNITVVLVNFRDVRKRGILGLLKRIFHI